MSLAATKDYSFYGCRLRSSLPLSLVPPCEVDHNSPAVALSLGEVPEALPETIWSNPFVSLSPDGTALIKVPVGRFLVRGGSEVLVAPAPDTELLELETFLVGAVAGVLLHQRNALPLHASCVEVGGAAVAITGPSGRGKSTFAKALVQRGATLVSDDICVVQFPEKGRPLVSQGSYGVRLWPDSRKMLQGSAECWSPIRNGHLKQVTQLRTSVLGTRPLAAIIRLAPTDHSSPGLRRLHGPSAVMPMPELVYRAALGRRLGRSQELFQGVMRLAMTTSVFELRRPRGLDRLDETVSWITGALETIE